MKKKPNTKKRNMNWGGKLLLLLFFLSAPGLAQEQDEPYKVAQPGTRRIHCMGQSWKIPVYNTSGPDVVMFRGDDPVLFEIARALGKTMRWSSEDTTLYGEDGVRLALGQTAMPAHGDIKELELPSQIVKGAVYVPSSALNGLMDCKVTVKPGADGAIYVEPILEHLSFAEGTPKSTELIARTSVPVRKKIFTLRRPARTVVDLVGVALPDGFESVEHPILGEIRVGQFQSAPSIARIVLPSDSGIKVSTKRSLDLFEHQLSVRWPSGTRPMAEREGTPARVETVQIAPTEMPDRKDPVVAIRPVAKPPTQTQTPKPSPPRQATSSSRPLLENAEWVGNRLKLTFSEPVEYRWSRVGVGTKRYVIDFPGVIFPRKKQALSSSVPGLQGIRVVQNMPEPQPIVRLVCDLDSQIAVDAEPEKEKILYLEFPGRKISAGEMPRGMGHTSQNIAQGSIGGRTICIDAGHGGSDPGALNRTVGVNEKTVTLDISMRLARYLKAQGWNVILTRTSDRDVSWAGSSAKQELGARARMANKYGADLFVSIHANASVKPSIQGSSIHWYKSADYRLAQLIEGGVMGGTGRKNRGLIKNRFYVLAHTTMPAVLIETAFLTNSTEGQLLADPNYRDRIARGIASGLQVYASRTFPVASAKK